MFSMPFVLELGLYTRLTDSRTDKQTDGQDE